MERLCAVGFEARTAALNQLRSLVVTAPEELRARDPRVCAVKLTVPPHADTCDGKGTLGGNSQLSAAFSIGRARGMGNHTPA